MQSHHTAQVLVIGAGPAGCAAALTLARAGIDTILVDQTRFPRDKVCGDALIPDALRALGSLGVAADVLPAARLASRLDIYAPDGSRVEITGRLAFLPRMRLDDTLRRAATAAGARFLAPLRLAAFVWHDGVVQGARFKASGSRYEVSVGARLVVLATGAAPAPLELAGVCLRKAPSGIALRGYFRAERLAGELDNPCISFDRSICPGYGWVFPGPDGVFNVGAGYFHDARRLPDAGSVRRVFAAFVERFPPARRVVAQGEPIAPLKGAPLRTALKGALLARRGLLVAGEAAGSTYSFSGEGIGKALETGVLAGEQAVALFHGHLDETMLAAAYTDRVMTGLAPRFAAYEAAQRWLSYPAVCNFIAARARRSARLREQLAGLLAESGQPGELFSWRGLLRLLVARS